MAKINDPRPHVVNVGYLNSAPYRVLQQIEDWRYSEASPAECARMLHEQECELALIPLAEYFSFGGYVALPWGIAAAGPVDSVYLLSERPLEELQIISLDSSSHSSATLLRLLIREMSPRLSTQLRFFRRAPEAALHSIGGTTGALLIGDIGLKNAANFAYRYDLASLWHELTGLPFVFAVWAAREESLDSTIVGKLQDTLKNVLPNRRILARAWAEQQNFSRELAESYVTERIIYPLNDQTLRGAEEFRQRGIRAGIFPGVARSLIPSMKLNELQRETTPPSGRVSRGGNFIELRNANRSLDSLLQDASNGLRISAAETLKLAAEASLADLALASDRRRTKLHATPGISYIIDRNINYTNVCNVYCRFCAFYRAPVKGGPREKNGGYLLSKEEIGEKIAETVAAGGIQILLQGGLNPELGIDYYEDLFRWIKANYRINLHALSADEILHIAKVSNLSLDEVFERLIAAGLGSLPGAGAEILVDRVRRRIARLKSPSEEWLEVHRAAHRHGITSTCTMLFGVQETWLDRVNHMHKLRKLQDETGGFTAFITWPFQEENTKLKRSNTSSTEYLRVQAISRLFFDNIDNIQSSWVTMGPSVGQVAIHFGANDFGSVMFEENVVSSAGTTYCMDGSLIERHIREAGFFPWPRDVHYRPVR